jgi:hypothetical protein
VIYYGCYFPKLANLHGKEESQNKNNNLRPSLKEKKCIKIPFLTVRGGFFAVVFSFAADYKSLNAASKRRELDRMKFVCTTKNERI